MKFLILLSIVAILVVSGCTQNIQTENKTFSECSTCNEGYECSDNLCIMTPETVVKEYLKSSNINGLDERIEKLEIVKRYTTGYLNERENVELEFTKSLKYELEDFLSSLSIICPDIYGKKYCDNLEIVTRSSTDSFFAVKVKPTFVKREEIEKNKAKIRVKMKVITSYNITDSTLVYLLVKENNSWLIYDAIDSNGDFLSQVERTEEISKFNNETVENLTEVWMNALQSMIDEKKR